VIDGLNFVRFGYDWPTDGERVGARLGDSNAEWWAVGIWNEAGAHPDSGLHGKNIAGLNNAANNEPRREARRF